MAKRTEAWWVCDCCHRGVIEVGAKRVKEAMLDHRKLCTWGACFQIKRMPQGTRRAT